MNYKFAREQTVGAPSHSREIRSSIIEFLKWALLEAGSYKNIADADPFGTLRLQKDANYSDYKVFASRRGFWPWETTTAQSTQPSSISVLVNGVTANPATYIVDYNNGRIIFNSAKSSSDVVTANYPVREIVVYDGGIRQVRELDFLSAKSDDFRLATAGGSGVDLEVPNSRKAHLPCIVVNNGYDFSAVGNEIGTTRLKANQDIYLECFSDNGWYLDWIHDTLVLEQDNVIPTYKLDLCPPSFMSDGSLNVNRQTFPVRCAAHPGLNILVKRASSRPGLTYGAVGSVTVVWNLEILPV